ncbi:MAG: hypothetical protein AAGA48_13745 [Myxococcota bacterium]
MNPQAFLAQIAKHPTPDQWRVLADLLAGRGDIRGPLLNAQLGDSLTLEQIRAHRAELLGPFGVEAAVPERPSGTQKGLAALVARASEPANEQTPSTEPGFAPCLLHEDWFGGFLIEATLARANGTSPPLEELLDVLLDQPAGVALRRLAFGSPSRHTDAPVDWSHVMRVLVKRGPHPWLKELRIGHPRDPLDRAGPTGSLQGLAQALPNLERLHIRDAVVSDFDFDVLAQLVSLEARVDPGTVWLEALKHPMSNLEQLVLDLPDFKGPFSTLRVVPLRFTSLRSLTLQRYARPRFLGEIVEHPILPQLDVLSVANCEIDEEGVAPLFADPDAFGHLKAFDLSGNQLSEDVVDNLGALFPDADLSDQDYYEEIME